jgi:hypothetical protein
MLVLSQPEWQPLVANIIRWFSITVVLFLTNSINCKTFLIESSILVFLLPKQIFLYFSFSIYKITPIILFNETTRIREINFDETSSTFDMYLVLKSSHVSVYNNYKFLILDNSNDFRKLSASNFALVNVDNLDYPNVILITELSY